MSNDAKSNEELSWSLEDQGYVFKLSSGHYHAVGESPEAENNLSFGAIQYIMKHGQVSNARAEKYLAWLKTSGRKYTHDD